MRRRLLSGALALPAAALLNAFSPSRGILRAADGKNKVKVAPADASSKGSLISEPLPAPVQDVCDGILAAVQSGDIAEIKGVLDLNEMQPMLATAPVEDPVAFLKSASADGEGREILAILANCLAVGFTKLPLGKDAENPAVYVWPYLAEVPLDKLTPAQDVDLYRLMPVALARDMRAKNKWTWYRLVIGADGTWHAFMKPE